MKKILLKKVKNCDILGKGVNIKIQGEDKVKSFSGGILTILLALCSILIVIYNFIEFLSNDNPRVSEESRVRNSTEIVSIPNSNLQFTVSLLDISDNIVKFMPLSIMDKYLKSWKSEAIPYINVTEEKIGDIVDCNNIDYGQDIKEEFSIFNYSNCLGVKFYNESIKSGGSFQLRYNVEASITTDLCYAFDAVTCHNLQNLQNIQRKSFALNYHQVFHNMRIKEGYYATPSLFVSNINLSKDYILKLVLTRHTIYSDTNLLFSLFNSTEIPFFTINISIEEVERNEQYANLMKITIQISVEDKEILHYRSYKKLDEMFANIFSIYSVLYFFADLIYEIFNFKFLEHKIMKKIYRIEQDDNLIRTNNYLRSNLILIQPRNKITINNTISQLNISPYVPNLQTFIQKLKNENNKLKYKKFLCLYICSKKKARDKFVNIYFKMEKLLYHDIDIVHLIKKSITIEYLKKIMLNDSQEHCLTLLIKRFIDLNIDTKKILRSYNISQYNSEEQAILYNSLNTVLSSNDSFDRNISECINSLYKFY